MIQSTWLTCCLFLKCRNVFLTILKILQYYQCKSLKIVYWNEKFYQFDVERILINFEILSRRH